MTAVGQVAETVLPVHEPDQTLCLQTVQQLLPNGTIQDRIGLLFVIEKEGGIP
ncbi:hypothetical protein D9M68_948360 [compost metagenome]